MVTLQGARQAPEQLIISDWTYTEFSAALSMKRRMGQLDAATRAQVLKTVASCNREPVVSLDRGLVEAALAAGIGGGLL